MIFQKKAIIPGLFFMLFFISACSTPQLAEIPANANVSKTELPTPARVASEITIPEPLPNIDHTPTPEIKICSTSLVRAIPEFNKKKLLTSFQTVDPVVVLTIDDGYSNTVFDQMLDILEEHEVSATFFLVGKSFGDKIKKETLIRLVENGNDIAYHSFAHPTVSEVEGMSSVDWQRDYHQWSETLLSVIGLEAYEKGVLPYARAPYGAWTAGFMKFLDEQGLTPVYWNADEHTFEANRMPLREGSILILHVKPEDLDELEKLVKTKWNVISLRQALGEVCE